MCPGYTQTHIQNADGKTIAPIAEAGCNEKYPQESHAEKCIKKALFIPAVQAFYHMGTRKAMGVVTVLELAIYKTNVLNKTTASLIYRGFL